MAFTPCRLHNLPSTTALTPYRPLFSSHSVSSSFSLVKKLTFRSDVCFRTAPRRRNKGPSFSGLGRGYLVCALSNTNSEKKLEVTSQKISDIDSLEPFKGKSGCVSFIGLSYQLVEEGKLVSSPFKDSRSLLWIWAPGVLISSLILPLLFGPVIDELSRNIVISELVISISSDILFYLGLATFLLVTDRVQRPYLEYSSKRWSLITGLRGYLTATMIVTGIKIMVPVVAVGCIWPFLGLPALVSVVPYMLGCFAQFAFEKMLKKLRSSAWPHVPLIFEVYRLYQLSKAIRFMETLMLHMRNATRGLPHTRALRQKNGAAAAMILVFEVLAVVCMWSFLTFLQRLFPSRPVAENY